MSPALGSAIVLASISKAFGSLIPAFLGVAGVRIEEEVPQSGGRIRTKTLMELSKVPED